MAAALGVDLRWRVVWAMEEEGLSIREAGRRLCIGESTAGRWHRLWRARGDVAPGRRAIQVARVWTVMPLSFSR